MIVSRGLSFLKSTSYIVRNQLFQNGRRELLKQTSRGAHGGEYFYRTSPPPNPKVIKHAEVLGAILWWWIIWHLLTDFHELLPPETQDPSKWTDEELGIPPDDAD